MTTQNESVLLDFQNILEHNEDILAAIVENLQLGRMEDCINHYSILQSNLVALGIFEVTWFEVWSILSPKKFLTYFRYEVYYTTLKINFTLSGNELDNYPAGETDPYEDILSFPDELMRKVEYESLSYSSNSFLCKLIPLLLWLLLWLHLKLLILLILHEAAVLLVFVHFGFLTGEELIIITVLIIMI